jgi:hypothetical protein
MYSSYYIIDLLRAKLSGPVFFKTTTIRFWKRVKIKE